MKYKITCVRALALLSWPGFVYAAHKWESTESGRKLVAISPTLLVFAVSSDSPYAETFKFWSAHCCVYRCVDDVVLAAAFARWRVELA